MNASILLKPIIALMLVCGLASAPLAATLSKHTEGPPVITPQQDDPDAEGVTFDNLLRESSYTLYIEARNIGALLHSTEFRDTFEPILPTLEQFGGMTDFLPLQLAISNAELLAHSRMMIAFNPVDPSLPSQMFAVELESEDAAQEFEAKLKERLAPPIASDGQHSDGDENIVNRTKSSLSAIRRAGNVIAFSTTSFTFKGLRGADDKTMNDDPNFRAAHDHFYTDSLFIYYDIALTERHRKAAEDQLHQTKEEDIDTVQQAPSAEAQSTAVEIKPEPPRPQNQEEASPLPVAPPVAVPDEAIDNTQSPKPTPIAATSPAAVAAVPRQAPTTRPVHSKPPAVPAAQAMEMQEAEKSTAPSGTDLLESLFTVLMSGGGPSQNPDAFAVALALENDSLAVRALLINAPGEALSPLPFWSQPICGPAISSEAANYMPANTDIFIAASIDWLRLVELAAQRQRTHYKVPGLQASPDQNQDFDARNLAFEKANHVCIADLLAATLGNEIALSIPIKNLGGGPLGRVPLRGQSTSAEPLMLIAVRDRKLFEPKLRSVFETIGVKLANAKATTEKVGDIEITNLGNLAYAFSDNYLMLASNAGDIRRAVEARASNTTLGASHNFQSYTQWQPTATIAQVYVSAEVLKGLFTERPQMSENRDEAIKEFLARYRFEPEPITYAVSAEGVGAHYELRIPKHLLMRFFAEMAASEMATRIPRNEMMARNYLQTLKIQETAYKKQHGQYGALDDLKDMQSLQAIFDRSGYKLELSASGSNYEATATPVEYGKTGRQSFYTDQSGIVRQGDHNGKPASSSDKAVDKNQEN